MTTHRRRRSHTHRQQQHPHGVQLHPVVPVRVVSRAENHKKVHVVANDPAVHKAHAGVAESSAKGQ